MTRAYDQLKQQFARMSDISGAQSILHWDQAVIMPVGSAAAHARIQATLSLMAHEIITSPKMAELLGQAREDVSDLDAWDRANLNEIHRAWVHASAVPSRLVEALTHAESDCQMTWRGARAGNDFASLAPKLQSLVGLVREAAAAKADVLSLTPYEALLDQFDPGSREVEIDRIFSDLQSWLPEMIGEVLEHQRSLPEPRLPQGPFPVARQEHLGRMVMQRIGFDFDTGRLDVSHHPFSGGLPEDSRITTRYDEADFTSSLMAVIHETGHALYERNKPRNWNGQPVGSARGMTMHESQSLLYEMQAARSDAFLNWLAPEASKTFAGNGPDWEFENIRRLYRTVRPSLIRVDADEVTYPMHILLRYRIERQLVAGKLEVGDLPDVWRTGMKDFLGIEPHNDAVGCLQDIHWPSGAFGYFPSYTLGALAAAQLFQAACAAQPDIAGELAAGSFETLNMWLKHNIHRQASLLPTGELIEQATGSPLTTQAFRRHLQARYLDS